MQKFASWKFDLLDRMSADPRLSATDFRTAYRLFSYMDAGTGDCFPRQETIATDLGLTDRTVRSALVNLRACGWLTIEERPLPKGRGKSNFYHFNDPTTGSAVPVNNTNTGNEIPVNASTTGNSAHDFRKSASAPSIDEHFEFNPLDKGKARKRELAPDRGTRIPEDFQPDLAEALKFGFRSDEASLEADAFRDHWRSKPGADGRKVDWPATWRNWCRREWKFRQRRTNGNGKPKQQDWPGFLKNESEQAHLRKGDGHGEAEPWGRPRLPPGNTR